MKVVGDRRGLANLHSIRWRLPLSYAGIALLAAIALGGILLLTLQQHYDRLERQYLDASAGVIAPSAEQLYSDRSTLTEDVFQSAANIFSFLVRTRVRLLDVDQQVIADSGTFSQQDVIGLDVRKPPLAEGGPGPEQSPVYETFLSIQGGWPDTSGNPPAESGSAPRYPIRFPPGATDRLLSGFVSVSARTNLSLTVPLHNAEGELLGYLELSESPAFGTEIIHDVAQKAIVAGIVAVLLAAAGGWFASRQISHPVLSLAETTRRMAEGDLSVRVALKRRDEFGVLARTFNTMAERVEDTVIALKRFVADAAHEINTPITALRTNLELAAAGNCSNEFRADIARAQVELERLETLTHGLLTLSRLEARGGERVRKAVDLSCLVQRAQQHHASRAEKAGIALTLNPPTEPVTIRADEKQMVRVLDNLLDNALKFTPSGGTVTVGLEKTPNGARLSVADTGIGIPSGDLPKLFSRFHRARNAAAYPGNGLGLVITKAIVEDHGGQIAVESDGRGTRFTVSLPYDGNERRNS